MRQCDTHTYTHPQPYLHKNILGEVVSEAGISTGINDALVRVRRKSIQWVVCGNIRTHAMYYS